MESIQQNGAVDLSHHLSTLSRKRHPSPLKDIIKFMAYDDMISLAGGLPHSSLFPFKSAKIGAYKAAKIADHRSSLSSPPFDELWLTTESRSDQPLRLDVALQYGSGSGDVSLRNWAFEFTKKVFEPAYKDFEILLNMGNTDGWCKVVQLLCEPGESILCEEHTYPSAQALWIPLGCEAVPVAMDESGLCPQALSKTLQDWAETHPHTKQPHLLYIVPVGSNPTGLTMEATRRKEIYDICVKYDVIICEDDPYSFLQFPEYDLNVKSSSPKATTIEQYLNSLTPSFLKYDTQGRVIRLDTFSKTLAPGLRLGYFVTNKMFSERLLRATEVQTQAPSGWSQAIVMQLLATWTNLGYLEWLLNLRDQYQMRRDWMCNSIADNFELKPAKSSNIHEAKGLVAFIKNCPSPVFSFVPPTGGMFIWAKFYLYGCSRFYDIKKNNRCVDPEQTFADELWAEMAKAKVLLTPGSYYTPWQGESKKTTSERGAEDGICHFRLSYSMTTKSDMEMGIARMAAVLRKYWNVSDK